MNDTLLKVKRLLRVDFVREALRQGGVFCLFLLLCRAQLPDAMAPFAPAAAAAAFYCSLPVGAALGCVAGCLSAGALDSAFSAVLALGLCWCSFKFSGRMVPRLLALCVAAGEGAALAFFRLGSGYAAVMGVLSVAAAALLFRVYAGGLTVALSLRCRKVIASDEMIALSILFGTFLIGLGTIAPFGVSLGAVLGALVTLLLAYTGGAGAGAACGVTLGVMLSLGGAWECLPAFSVLGLAAGGMRPLKKPGAALGAVLGAMAVTMYSRLDFTPLVAALIAAGVFLALPEPVFAWTSGFVNAAVRRERSKQEYARRLKRELKERLETYKEIFDQLGRIFEPLPAGEKEPFDMNALRPVCAGCAAENRCWSDPERLRGELNGAFRGVAQIRLSRCGRLKELYAAAATIEKERAKAQKAREAQAQAERLVQQQLSGLSGLLESMTEAMEAPVRFDDKLAAAVLSRLELNLTPAVDASVRLTEKGPSVTVAAKECCGQCEGRMKAAVSLACGRAMEPVKKRCQNGCQAVFEPARAIKAVSGVASEALEGVCGDSTLVCPLSGGRQLVALCDGCGAGPAAAKESGEAIALMGRLFQAGMDTPSVMYSVNRLLSARRETDMYTTMDCCVIDDYTGECDFAKQNAAKTVWVSRSGVKLIAGDSLPAGIIESAAPAVTKVLLRGGDWLFFASDGVSDALGEAMSQVCSGAAYGEPKAAAAAVLAAAKQQGVKDDMTVLAVRIDEND